MNGPKKKKKKKLQGTYVMEQYTSLMKNEILVICDSVGISEAHQLNQISQAQKEILYDLIYMQSLKMFISQKQRVKRWLVTRRGGGERDGERGDVVQRVQSFSYTVEMSTVVIAFKNNIYFKISNRIFNTLTAKNFGDVIDLLA